MALRKDLLDGDIAFFEDVDERSAQPSEMQLDRHGFVVVGGGRLLANNRLRQPMEEQKDAAEAAAAAPPVENKADNNAQNNNSKHLRDPLLIPGDVLGGRWRIDADQLSKGGFGQVYRARDLRRVVSRPVAIKIELVASGRTSTVAAEADTLSAINGQLCRLGHYHPPTKHVLNVYDQGRTPDCDLYYLVMDLCGETIRDRKKATANDRLSVASSLSMAVQMVSAVRQIHNAGYLHRDVKPANFCFGIGGDPSATQENLLYVIDFGLARKLAHRHTPTYPLSQKADEFRYVHHDGRLRAQRDTSSFRGTVRYASVNTHRHRDMGRLDDLWPIFYITAENVRSHYRRGASAKRPTVPAFIQIVGQLPWRCLTDKAEVLRLKEATDFRLLLSTRSQQKSSSSSRRRPHPTSSPSSEVVPDSLMSFHRRLSKMGFDSRPDYEAFIERMKRDEKQFEEQEAWRMRSTCGDDDQTELRDSFEQQNNNNGILR